MAIHTCYCVPDRVSMSAGSKDFSLVELPCSDLTSSLKHHQQRDRTYEYCIIQHSGTASFPSHLYTVLNVLINPIFTLVSNALFCFILFYTRILFDAYYFLNLFWICCNITNVLFLFCFDFCHKACWIPAPQPGTEPSPTELVLTTKPPRESIVK